jgi:hypothetical protein
MSLRFGLEGHRQILIFFSAALFVALVVSCQRNHVDETVELIEVEAEDIAVAHDPFDLLDASIIGDSLMLSVRYGGGCREHEFALETGPILKSLPPKQLISISHDANGDNCRALIQKIVWFDLSSFQGSPRGITVIVLNEMELIYEYP